MTEPGEAFLAAMLEQATARCAEAKDHAESCSRISETESDFGIALPEWNRVRRLAAIESECRERIRLPGRLIPTLVEGILAALPAGWSLDPPALSPDGEWALSVRPAGGAGRPVSARSPGIEEAFRELRLAIIRTDPTEGQV